MIYLVGPPGSGKSMLMSLLTAGLMRLSYGPPEVPVAHDVLVDKVTGVIIGAEIGMRRGLIDGTDALPSSIIEKAIPWVESEPYELLLGEGARLSNLRFLKAATASYHVIVVFLDHPEAETWRKIKARAVGREQNLSWVKGRIAASRNLAAIMDNTEGVTVLRAARSARAVPAPATGRFIWTGPISAACPDRPATSGLSPTTSPGCAAADSRSTREDGHCREFHRQQRSQPPRRRTARMGMVQGPRPKQPGMQN